MQVMKTFLNTCIVSEQLPVGKKIIVYEGMRRSKDKGKKGMRKGKMEEKKYLKGGWISMLHLF